MKSRYFTQIKVTAKENEESCGWINECSGCGWINGCSGHDTMELAIECNEKCFQHFASKLDADYAGANLSIRIMKVTNEVVEEAREITKL